MTRWDRIAALLLLGFAAYTAIAAREMGYLQGRIPGPGFLPLWIGVALGVAALAILAGSRESREETPPTATAPRTDDAGHAAAGETPPAAGRFGPTLALIAITVAAVALIERAGMMAALALMLLGLVRILGGAWRTAVLTAVGLPAAFHLVFALWLKVPLPRGPWGF